MGRLKYIWVQTFALIPGFMLVNTIVSWKQDEFMTAALISLIFLKVPLVGPLIKRFHDESAKYGAYLNELQD